MRRVALGSGRAAVAALFITACSTPPPSRDVVDELPEPGDACTTMACVDARGEAGLEGGSDAGADATSGDTGGLDASLDAAPDVMETPGPCSPTNRIDSETPEARAAARPVFVASAASDGYAVGVRVQRSGFDNVNLFFALADSDAGPGPSGDVSMLRGAIVTGGALARDGANWVQAYSSNQVNGFEIYLRRAAIMMPAGMGSIVGPVGAAARVSTDPLTSENPRVAATPTGWTVVWRSRNDMTGAVTLTAAAVAQATFTAGAVATIPLAGSPGSYELVSDGARTALVYVDVQPTTANVNVVQLGPTGAATGAPIALTSMAHVGEVSASLRGDDLAVVWAEVRSGVALHARRVNLASGAAEAQVDLAMLGASAAGPGITRDGTAGFALGYRAVGVAGSVVRMARLDTAFMPRESASLVGTGSTGEAVRIATNDDGTYAVGWADVTGGQTSWAVQVMRCP